MRFGSKKKNKYHNVKQEKYGQKWDSEMELDYYESVCLPNLESGEWLKVDTQQTFILQEKFKYKDKTILPIKYIADFVIETKEHELIIVDTKGMPPTSDFKLKWKMMKYKYHFMLSFLHPILNEKYQRTVPKSTIYKYHSLFVEQTQIISKEKDDRIISIALFIYRGGASGI